jgi:hypothetical protein
VLVAWTFSFNFWLLGAGDVHASFEGLFSIIIIFTLAAQAGLWGLL